MGSSRDEDRPGHDRLVRGHVCAMQSAFAVVDDEERNVGELRGQPAQGSSAIGVVVAPRGAEKGALARSDAAFVVAERRDTKTIARKGERLAHSSTELAAVGVPVELPRTGQDQRTGRGVDDVPVSPPSVMSPLWNLTSRDGLVVPASLLAIVTPRPTLTLAAGCSPGSAACVRASGRWPVGVGRPWRGHEATP